MVAVRPWQARVGVLFAYTALSWYFTSPLFSAGSETGIADWDAHLFQYSLVAASLHDFGQWPFWNAWSCGGQPLWQNPQTALVSPVYLLTPWMSVATAMKLTVTAHYLAGFAGMHLLLTRALGLISRPIVVCLAALFVLAGGIAFHLIVGHSTFLPYFYLPWLLWAFLRAIDRPASRATVAAGAILALSVFNGGIHIAFMAGVGLAIFAVATAVCRRDWRPLAALVAVGVMAGLLSAPKTIPAMAYISDDRLIDTRTFHEPDMMTPGMVVHAFADPFQYPRMIIGGQVYGWHEYGNYLGFLGAPLVLAALIWLLMRRPRVREYWLELSSAFATVVLLGLMAGEVGPFSPYELLSHLPLVSQFRVPSRYSLVAVLFATMLVASVVQRLLAGERSGDPAGLRRLLTILLLLSTASLAYQNQAHMGAAFPAGGLPATTARTVPLTPPVIDAETDGFAHGGPMMRSLWEGRNILQCNEPFRLPGSLDPARPLVFAMGDAKVVDLQFTPNEVRFGVLTGAAQDSVVLNTKYIEGWLVNGRRPLIDPATGLAALTVAPWTSAEFVFTFRPPGLTTGLVLLGVGLLLGAGLGWWPPRSGRAGTRRAPGAQPA